MPEGVTAALRPLELLQLLEDAAAAHGPVQKACTLANGTLTALRQHHPLRPVQHRSDIGGAAAELATDGLSAAATTVKTDVVLVEIGCARHHDQGAGRLIGITAAGGLHQGLHRPTGTILQAFPLHRPAGRPTGQHPQDQSRATAPWTPLPQPQTPLPPAAAEQQQQ